MVIDIVVDKNYEVFEKKVRSRLVVQ